MFFFPKQNNVAELQAQSIIADLKHGKIDTLIAYLKDLDSDSSARVLIIGLILMERDRLNWIFDLEEFEKEVFSRVPAFSKDELTNLRPHFLHAKKFAEHQSLEDAYYIEGTDILWNRFFEDLEALPIDKTSHFYLNLKQYLELGSYQTDQKKPEMISKILFPFYKHLRDNPVVPFPFLVEILKIILILNPRHAKALLEYASIQKNRGDSSGLLKTLSDGFESGVRDREFLIILLRECLHQSKIDQLSKISRILFLSRIPNLDSYFFEEVREILFRGSLYTEALFYGLKAFSFQSNDQSRLAPLRKIFYALGNISFGELCYSLSEQRAEPSEAALVLDRNLSETGLLYKFKSMQGWVQVTHPFLFIKGAKNPRVELFHPSLAEPMIFYPTGNGPYILKYEPNSMKVLIEPMTIQVPGDAVTYRYLDYQFESSEDGLKNLTPYDFSEMRPGS